jgi:hypothetical protein
MFEKGFHLTWGERFSNPRPPASSLSIAGTWQLGRPQAPVRPAEQRLLAPSSLCLQKPLR